MKITITRTVLNEANGVKEKIVTEIELPPDLDTILKSVTEQVVRELTPITP